MTIDRTTRKTLRAATTALSLFAATLPAAAQGEVNIYSYREPGLMEPLLKAFSAKTGIKANVVFANAGLNERLVAEGRNSPADVLLTVDISRLVDAKDQGVTQPIPATVIANIPSAYRDADSRWTALTMRARVVYASKDRVKQDKITYEDLADPKWKGKVCTRSGQHAYNTALLASIIAHKGQDAAEAWAKGLKANLARKPAGGDRESVRDVKAGLCDVAIGNTYYMAAMLKNPDQKTWADAVRIIFPNADDRGSHVNVSGVALMANAPHKDNALKLIGFLASDEGQKLYAEINNEYPVDQKVEPSAMVKSWGTLKADALPLVNIAKFRKQASEIMDRVGFDAGPN